MKYKIETEDSQEMLLILRAWPLKWAIDDFLNETRERLKYQELSPETYAECERLRDSLVEKLNEVHYFELDEI